MVAYTDERLRELPPNVAEAVRRNTSRAPLLTAAQLATIRRIILGPAEFVEGDES